MAEGRLAVDAEVSRGAFRGDHQPEEPGQFFQRLPRDLGAARLGRELLAAVTAFTAPITQLVELFIFRIVEYFSLFFFFLHLPFSIKQ